MVLGANDRKNPVHLSIHVAFFTRIITVIVICLPKKDVGVLKRVRVFQVELEFISGGFERRKKEKP